MERIDENYIRDPIRILITFFAENEPGNGGEEGFVANESKAAEYKKKEK